MLRTAAHIPIARPDASKLGASQRRTRQDVRRAAVEEIELARMQNGGTRAARVRGRACQKFAGSVLIGTGNRRAEWLGCHLPTWSRSKSRRADSNRGPLHYEDAAAFVPGYSPWRTAPTPSRFPPSRPITICGWCRVVCCHPVACRSEENEACPASRQARGPEHTRYAADVANLLDYSPSFMLTLALRPVLKPRLLRLACDAPHGHRAVPVKTVDMLFASGMMH